MMSKPKGLTMREKHPELFMPETNIDRRQCQRVVPMEVMNLGFPRTGTMCKSDALQTYCYTIFGNLQLVSMSSQ